MKRCDLPPPVMPITLLTDFGTRDTYVGQMKGAIAAIAPQANVIDLTHNVPRQDIALGAVMLDSAVDAFPDASVHVAVVDPGVGGARRAIAAQCQRFTLVGPDNGLFTAVWQRHPPRRIVTLTSSAHHRPRVSPTFHGRDVFAPVAAHLVTSAMLEDLGETITDPIMLELPEPQQTDTGYELRVLCIDHFGNLITNMTERGLPAGRVAIAVGPARIDGIRQTFADVPEGEPVAYLGSSGRLEIGIRNDSAAARWRLHVGDPIHMTCE